MIFVVVAVVVFLWVVLYFFSGSVPELPAGVRYGQHQIDAARQAVRVDERAADGHVPPQPGQEDRRVHFNPKPNPIPNPYVLTLSPTRMP